MKKNQISGFDLFITLFTLGLFLTLFSEGNNIIINAGVTDIIKDVHRFMEGWNTFFTRLSAVTSLVGFKTVLLFLAVLVISSGLSAIGIPRGKFSFFSALFIIDMVWIAFKDSFNPGTLDYLGPIIRANLTLSIPVLLLYGVRLLIARLWPRLKGRIKKSDKTRDSSAEEILTRSIDLYRSLKENPSGSSVTRQSEELRSLLEKLK